MDVRNAMTADFLRSAFGGESMARMRYELWAERAREEKFPNVARLFEAVAFAERVHAGNHFRALGGETGDATVAAGAVFGLGSSADNLGGAIRGELHEAEQMYPVYMETAKFQQEDGARRSFQFAFRAEQQHARLFEEAKRAVLEGRDMEFTKIIVCPVCGYTALDAVPDRCTVCGAKRDAFREF